MEKHGILHGHVFLFLFARKHRLWVHVHIRSTSGSNVYPQSICFEDKYEKYHNFSSENYQFYSRENGKIAEYCMGVLS